MIRHSFKIKLTSAIQGGLEEKFKQFGVILKEVTKTKVKQTVSFASLSLFRRERGRRPLTDTLMQPSRDTAVYFPGDNNARCAQQNLPVIMERV